MSAIQETTIQKKLAYVPVSLIRSLCISGRPISNVCPNMKVDTRSGQGQY